MILVLCTCSVFAKTKSPTKQSQFFFRPYLGLEYQYIHIKAKSDWRNLLSANYNNGGAFLGIKFHKYFGLEAGYYKSLKTSQEQNTIQEFNSVDASGPTWVRTQTKYKGFSFDFNVFVPLDPNFNFNLFAGVMTLHPNFTITATSNTDLGQAMNAVTAKNTTCFRTGLGFEYHERHWGARGRLVWINTKHMTLNTQNASQFFPAINDQAYNQTFGGLFGIFFIF